MVYKLAGIKMQMISTTLTFNISLLVMHFTKMERRTNEIKCILMQEVYDHHSISEEYLS